MMDELFSSRLDELQRCLKRINPLATVLGDYLDTLLQSGDLSNASGDQKQITKKKYLDWCRKNHPDKNDEVDEDSMYVYQHFGSAFLRYSDTDNDRVWMYMGFSAVTFQNIDFTGLNISSIYRLIRDCDVLEDIINPIMGETVVGIIRIVREILHFMISYMNAKTNGHCTSHSSEENLVLKSECPQCASVDTALNNIHEVILVDEISSSSSDSVWNFDNEAGPSRACYDESIDTGINSGGCNREKVLRDHIKMELNSLNVKTLIAIAKAKDLNVEGILEKSELISLIVEHDISDTEMRNIRNHKKRENPSKYTIPISTWENCDSTSVICLPYDIDGIRVYKLKIDHDNRMGATADGRKWCTWVTSSRKGFNGLRRTANCAGGYICLNHNCKFYRSYGKENTFHFRTKGVCKVCEETGKKIVCRCKKIWEFDEETEVVTIYHYGDHNCTAVPFASCSESELGAKFSNRNIKPQEAANQLIVEALEKDIDDIDNVVDSVIDQQKVKNLKKKIVNEKHPLGHSFEAVAEFKSRVSKRDKFFIYRINDRKMNDKISYVFKTSEALLDVAVVMNKDGDGWLKNEYAYFDGTFKRCPGYVTLACHVYVELLRSMVKIFSMETESESTECTELCWNLFNAALKEHTGDDNIMFNPIGWVQDEAGGFWNGLRKVFGESAVSRSVSCEWHYSQSYKKQMTHLKFGRIVFEKIATRLMLATNENDYESTLNDLEDFIEENIEDREFLIEWISWWDRRREHFSRAYKHPSAPNTNLAECYNSKYVRVNEINLKLVDSAKLDTAAALKYERTYKQFGEGMPVSGNGPSESQRLGRDINDQKKRGRQYAASVLNDENDEVSPKRRRHWQKSGATASTGKRKSNAAAEEEKRKERFRTSRSRKFLKSLQLARENHRHITLLSVSQVHGKFQQCSLKYFNKLIKVDIKEKPVCSCSYFLNSNVRSLETCCHIIWVLLNYYRITEDDHMLHQVAWTSKEIGDMFDKTPDVDIMSPGAGSSILTSAEEESILESKRSELHWKLDKMKERSNARCSSAQCKSTMPTGKIFVAVDGWYIPPNQKFAVERKFYFCASFSCLKCVPSSTIVAPTKDVVFEVVAGTNLTSDDKELLQYRGFQF